MALFNKNKTLRPRSYSGAGAGSGKCRKLDRLEDRTPWRVKTQGCSRRTARFIFRAGFLLGGGGAELYDFSTFGCLSCRWILSKAKKDDTDDEIAKYDGESNPGFG